MKGLWSLFCKSLRRIIPADQYLTGEVSLAGCFLAVRGPYPGGTSNPDLVVSRITNNLEKFQEHNITDCHLHRHYQESKSWSISYRMMLPPYDIS